MEGGREGGREGGCSLPSNRKGTAAKVKDRRWRRLLHFPDLVPPIQALTNAKGVRVSRSGRVSGRADGRPVLCPCGPVLVRGRAFVLFVEEQRTGDVRGEHSRCAHWWARRCGEEDIFGQGLINAT